MVKILGLCFFLCRLIKLDVEIKVLNLEFRIKKEGKKEKRLVIKIFFKYELMYYYRIWYNGFVYNWFMFWSIFGFIVLFVKLVDFFLFGFVESSLVIWG